MEKKSTFIVMAIAIVLSSIFAIEGNKLGVFLSLWSGVSSMIIFHYIQNKRPANVDTTMSSDAMPEVVAG